MFNNHVCNYNVLSFKITPEFFIKHVFIVFVYLYRGELLHESKSGSVVYEKNGALSVIKTEI